MTCLDKTIAGPTPVRAFGARSRSPATAGPEPKAEETRRYWKGLNIESNYGKPRHIKTLWTNDRVISLFCTTTMWPKHGRSRCSPWDQDPSRSSRGAFSISLSTAFSWQHWAVSSLLRPEFCSWPTRQRPWKTNTLHQTSPDSSKLALGSRCSAGISWGTGTRARSPWQISWVPTQESSTSPFDKHAGTSVESWKLLSTNPWKADKSRVPRIWIKPGLKSMHDTE